MVNAVEYLLKIFLQWKTGFVCQQIERKALPTSSLSQENEVNIVVLKVLAFKVLSF